MSVIAASSEVKVMIITKKDKAYFNENIKKVLDERIQEKKFIDFDRPVKK